MKNYRLLMLTCLLMILCIFTYVGCNKNDVKLKPQSVAVKTTSQDKVSAPTNKPFFENHVQAETHLLANNETLLKLYNSDVWKTIPKNILSSINTELTPKLETYDNTKIQTIIFDMINNDSAIHYKSLVIYLFNDNFLPLIIKNEMLKTGNSQISFTDLTGTNYLDFQVDKNSRFGKFETKKDIPFETITGFKGPSKSIHSIKVNSMAAPTCMESTPNFSSCMNCLVAECTSDWSCAIGCAVEAPACAALMVASCAIANA